MLSAIAAVLLSQFPVELPRELGHLRMMSGKASDKGVEIELEYENVTEVTFASVGVECTVFDHRDVAVNDEYKVLNNSGQGFAPGARAFVSMVVPDRVTRGRRAECAVTRANKSPVQVASAATEEMMRQPIVRERPPAAVIEPEPEATPAPAPAPVPAPTPAPASVTKPPEEKVVAPPAAATTTTPAKPVTAPPAAAPPAAKVPPPVVTPAPIAAPAPATPAPAGADLCCKKCGGTMKACGDSCIPIAQKCREWTGCACTVE